MRPGQTYDIAIATGVDAHDAATSTGVANVATLVAPAHSNGFYIACETNGIRFVLDGTTPDGTNGIPVAAGAAPLFVPVGRRSIRFVSQAAANATAHVLWLT